MQNDSLDSRLDLYLEAALRRPPEVSVPPGFAARTLARAPAARRARRGLFPWALAAAGLLFAILGAALHSHGWFLPLLGGPALCAAAGLEAGFSLLWLWRTAAG